MENESLRIAFDRHGRIRSLYDKRALREVLASPAPVGAPLVGARMGAGTSPAPTGGALGNQFILFEDKPVNFDAWDIDIFYTEKPLITDGELLSVQVLEKGPVGSVVRFRRKISKSVIKQDIILVAGSPRVDFLTHVEWGDEKEVLLKVAFPVNVRAERARYEIQFGNLERPTHWNTPWDFAKFEVVGHKWADLSEGDYGVALLNDAKYGHDIKGNVMRLSLLRAPKSPDPVADVNKTHTFTYSLLPHSGDYRNGVVRAGYELNVPVIAAAVAGSSSRRLSSAAGGQEEDQDRGRRRGRERLGSASLMSVSGDNVVIDTVKKAEDDDGIIVRMYEAHGCRGRRTFRTGLPVRRVVETNLMEKEERRLPLREGKVAVDFAPFQIRTLKLVLR